MISARNIGRREFLLGAGGVAAAALAACAGSEQERVRYGPQLAGAQSPTPGGHDVGAPTGADRPKASGNLATIYDATLPPVTPSPLVIEALDRTVEVAGGVMLNAWTFDGLVPGKVVRLRQGDALDFTLRNNGTIGHSIDFHAAQTPWNINYKTIVPGEEISFRWTANFPGVFMYHCGTGPVLEHIANGMYGTVIVDPAQPFAPAREYVLVQSEFYLKQGDGGRWDGDLQRMAAVQPDFVTFNGAANQYQQEPLTAAPGELIRLYVMNAGPTLFSAFHVIGAVFDTVYVEGNPANPLRGIQTWTIPPGGGATFELRIPEAGQYPFVTHSFAYTGLGAVGLIEVG